MKWVYKILRTVIVTSLILLAVLPAGVYVALSLPSVQNAVRSAAEKELSKLLNVDVDIDHVSITPFNRAMLYGVRVHDSEGETALTVRKLGAGLSIWSLLVKDRLELSYAEIIGLEANIYKATPESPLNIQPIIDALKPKDKNNPPTKFDFRVNTVVLRTSCVRYNVLSAPRDSGRLDMNHIGIYGINADVRLPEIKNDDFTVVLRRLTLKERSGLTVEDLTGRFHVSATGTEISDLSLKSKGTAIAFSDIGLRYSSWDYMKTHIRELNADVSLLEGSHVTPADFACFAPVLRCLDKPVDVNLHVSGSLDAVTLHILALRNGDIAGVEVRGWVRNVPDVSKMRFEFPKIDIDVNGNEAARFLSKCIDVSDKGAKLMSNAGYVKLHAEASGTFDGGTVSGKVLSHPGDIDIHGEYEKAADSGDDYILTCTADIDGFNGAELFEGTSNGLAAIGPVSAEIKAAGHLREGKPEGMVEAQIYNAVYRGHQFSDVSVRVDAESDEYSAMINSSDPWLDFDLTAALGLDGKNKKLAFDIDARNVDIGLFMDNSKLSHLSLNADVDLSGKDADHVEGYVIVRDFSLLGDDGEGVRLKRVEIDTHRQNEYAEMTLKSDMADGKLSGRYHSSSIVKVCKSLMADVLPGLTGSNVMARDDKFWNSENSVNELSLDMTIKDLSPLAVVMKLPVKVIYPVDVTGFLSSGGRRMSVNVSAPFLQQGDKLVENTALSVDVSGVSAERPEGEGHLSFSTMMPTKNGMMALNTWADAINDRVDTKLAFKVDRERIYEGNINVSTQFSHDEEGVLRTDLYVNPSEIVINDTVWNMSQSQVVVSGKDIRVSGFKVGRPGQYVAIDGTSTESETDSITVSLRDVNLDYVFETLDISNVLFGGNATGRAYAKQVLTKNPVAYTPGLNIRRLSYNNSLLGDAIIKSEWNNQSKAVTLDVDIFQEDGRKSKVDVRLVPAVDSLDLHFDTDRIPIGFLKPFMSAFATDVSGYATGKVRLWGTFKLVDIVGTAYGEDVKLTLGLTNTTYTTSDTLRLTPGKISIDDFTLHDVYGHTAKLNGWLGHKYLKEARFNFSVMQARDFLVYDVKENKDQMWFGRIFGNGSVKINGEPGKVSVTADISTGQNSAFTFVLSDALNAQNYNFITFRDKNQAHKDSIAALSAPPAIVRELKERMKADSDEGAPSVYLLNFAIDVNPQALITLVMDPVAGDKIKAYGRGNMRMTYDSRDDDLWLNGNYTVERGSYNFTLQDIIIKEFAITDGSSITFHGDPNAAKLDINATYALNANLTDLDESFAADKELNRTNVPVHAVLKVSGDVRQPEIGYDLNFPTLSQDVYRKVRSIVSTEEMMNRQIIYLLALNRFYTPDYVNATHGNELVSVASSTISSQLGSMLGQLSDNWVIAPNFRSSRGDFSDMEVDLALSSHLLNNRLLLNGNFGYRDKTLNNNSFVGDFDIEYLLNRSGSIRLKAYNRYNDQNYYVKSALTTQGVGIVFKRDFDNLLSFLKPWWRRKKSTHESESVTVPQDTVPVVSE